SSAGASSVLRPPPRQERDSPRLGPWVGFQQLPWGLIGQSPCVKSSADDGLVSKLRRLNQTPAIIARASLLAYAAVLCNGREMFFTLGRVGLALNGIGVSDPNGACRLSQSTQPHQPPI